MSRSFCSEKKNEILVSKFHGDWTDRKSQSCKISLEAELLKKIIQRNHQMQTISIEVDIPSQLSFQHQFEFDVKKIVKELILREC